MEPEVVVGRVLGVERSRLGPDTSSEELESWDSLAHVNLILELESVYGVSVSPQDAMAMKDVASIRRILREHGATW